MGPLSYMTDYHYIGCNGIARICGYEQELATQLCARTTGYFKTDLVLNVMTLLRWVHTKCGRNVVDTRLQLALVKSGYMIGA